MYHFSFFSALEEFHPLNSFRSKKISSSKNWNTYCHNYLNFLQFSDSKKNSSSGNYIRKYGMHNLKLKRNYIRFWHGFQFHIIPCAPLQAAACMLFAHFERPLLRFFNEVFSENSFSILERFLIKSGLFIDDYFR